MSKQRQLEREDQEFLPAALEILETPPSPIHTALIYFFASMVVVALLWGWFGRLDIVATAQGKIQPSGRVKIIQPTEIVKVLQINAINGTRVKEGDVLVAFDASDARADYETLENSRFSLEAEVLRRDAATLVAKKPEDIKDLPKIAWPETIPPTIREREANLLQSDIGQLAANLASLSAQLAQKEREHDRFEQTIRLQGDLIKTLQERVDIRSQLVRSGSGTKTSLIDGKENLQGQQTNLAHMRGQMRETEAAIQVLKREYEKLIQNFIADNNQKRNLAARNLDETIQRFAKAQARLNNMALKSPVDGIVQASTIFTIGQVLTVGQEIMRVVPTSGALEVEVYFQNKDIGFLHENQHAVIKVDSFPFTRYGMLNGRVKQIAQDAVPLSDVNQAEINSSARASESSGFGGTQRTQNLFFPVTITLEDATLNVDGHRVLMSPGMTVVAEVQTGNRRILEYLFSPIIETTSGALKER